MNVRCTCPCEDEQAERKDNGSDTTYFESSLGGDCLSGGGLCSSFFVVVILEGGEGYTEDQADSDSEEC